MTILSIYYKILIMYFSQYTNTNYVVQLSEYIWPQFMRLYKYGILLE